MRETVVHGASDLAGNDLESESPSREPLVMTQEHSTFDPAAILASLATAFLFLALAPLACLLVLCIGLGRGARRLGEVLGKGTADA
jgi:hypothetical protein